MVKIEKLELKVESETYLNKCPACGFIGGTDEFDPIKGHGGTVSKFILQCPKCYSLLNFKKE